METLFSIKRLVESNFWGLNDDYVVDTTGDGASHGIWIAFKRCGRDYLSDRN